MNGKEYSWENEVEECQKWYKDNIAKLFGISGRKDIDHEWRKKQKWRKITNRNEMTDSDHEELLKMLLQSKAKIMLSGYESDMYNDYLAGWGKTVF